MRTGKPS
ncbi:unnamed protein product, partial [Allacma fusca]